MLVGEDGGGEPAQGFGCGQSGEFGPAGEVDQPVLAEELTEPRRQTGLPRASMRSQVKQQRRGYAQAVLRALARSQRGRSTPQIRRVLRDALSPLGVRLPPAVLQELAAGIAAGRPVELP